MIPHLKDIMRTGKQVQDSFDDYNKLEWDASGLKYALGYVLLVGLMLLLCINCAWAGDIPEAQAVRAIIGEAGGEGLDGMRAVASAIRNRGTLKGVYGLKAKHVDKEPAWVWDMARKAWNDSARHDYANGADHWEGTAFKTPKWAKGMTVTARIGRQVFYKSK